MKKQDMSWLFEGLDEKELEFDDLLIDISLSIARERIKRDMTQKDFAKKLEVTQAMVSKIESCEYNFTLKKLFDIAYKLNLKLKVEFAQKESHKKEQIVEWFSKATKDIIPKKRLTVTKTESENDELRTALAA